MRETNGVYFKPLHRKIKVKRIASVDTEDDGKGTPFSLRIIGFYDGYEYRYFTDRYSFINFLYNYKAGGKLYIGATNLEYDIINLFKGYWDNIELFYGNHLIYAKLKDKKIYFFDTLNHYKESVKKMGEVVGLHKLDADVTDIDKIPFDELKEYNKRDCEITYHFMIEYQSRLNIIGAEMNFTIASSALNLYRRKFMFDRIRKPDDEVLDMWRNAYYGGRTEIFTLKANGTKKRPILYYDVNSLYPYVMKTQYYPVPDSWYPCTDIAEYGLVHADVEVFDTYIPYLPKRFMNKLVFPVGKITGWWTSAEIKFALENKLIRVHKIHKAYGFTAHTDYFSQYVDTLYNMRKEAIQRKDKFMDISLKLLMNSLYGKFGERVESKLAMSENGEITEIKLEETYYPKHTNYVISEYVTAYARTHLYKGLKKVVDSNGILLYCDTDSILFHPNDSKGEEILNTSKELGDFKLEGKFLKAEFFQPKAYRLTDIEGKETIKVKGVPSKYAKSFLENGYAMIRKPIRLRESIKRVDKVGYSANKWVDIKKVFTSSYDKRELTGSRDTEPLRLKEW